MAEVTIEAGLPEAQASELTAQKDQVRPEQGEHPDPAVTSRRYQIILLHTLVTVVLGYELLFSTHALVSFRIKQFIVFELILTSVALALIPIRLWAANWLAGSLAVADTVVTTLVIYLSGHASSDLYLTYFLIVLMAAFAPTLHQMIGLSATLCIAYATSLYMDFGEIGSLATGHLLQIPVLLIMAVYYGVTTEAARKLGREKMSLLEHLSERKRMEEALRESEERFAAFMDNSPAVAFMKDEAGRFAYANKPFERRFNLNKPDWAGKTDLDLWPAPIAEQMRTNDQAVLAAGTAKELEETMPTPDNRLHSWMVFKFPLRDSSGRQYLGCIALDITERKQLEAQFRQAQKMEAVGRLAGGIAHDFNNLLTIIVGYTQRLLSRCSSKDTVYDELQEISKAGYRAASLTQQLLAFSRRQMLQPKILDLNAVVSDTSKMLQRMIGEDIRLATELAPDLGSIKVDPGQMEQVIMNLAVNARDAMPQGGKLTIETENVDLERPMPNGPVTVAPGRYVVLSVRDTGQGMDADIQARIFEPFFTTKEPGKGTGLGLSTVYGIAKQSGGYIFVSSQPGRGTTFRLYLPRAQEAAELFEPGDPSGASTQGSGTLLLAEDEVGVRALVRRILEGNGYTILEASNGAEALELYERCNGSIDLLITDVVMPGGMSGRQLADRLLAKRSTLKVLYVSGYTDEAIGRHGVLEKGVEFLKKPFTPEGLARKVRDVLEAPRQDSQRHAVSTSS